MTTRSLLSCALLALCACNAEPSLDVGAPLALQSEHAGNPTAAAAGDNSAYIAWVSGAGTGDVMLARLEDGTAGSPVVVNDIARDAAPHDQAPPQVRVAPDGTVFVLWQNNNVVPGRRFPYSNLRLARSSNGGRSFEPAIFVNDDADQLPASHTFHDIAVGADGTVYVSWIDGRERARAEIAAGQPARAHGTHAHGATNMPGSDVRVARSTDRGRTFAPGVVVYRDVCPCCRTSLAVAPEGRVHVAYRSAGEARDIVVSRSDDRGASFGEPVVVHADGWKIDGCPHAGASLGVSSDGALHVSWYTAAEGRQGIWYAHSADGAATFSAPVALQTEAWVPVAQTKLAVDAQDNVWIAWDDRREKQYRVHLALAREGSIAQRLELEDNGQSPAMAGGSDAWVAWQTGAGPVVRRLSAR
jgi:hypothetical protein